MYTGVLDVVQNDCNWVGTAEILDDETGALVDLTGTTIRLTVRDPRTNAALLHASTTDSTISILSTGVFQWNFTKAQMGALCDHTYNVGITFEKYAITDSLFNGTLSVLQGIVRNV